MLDFASEKEKAYQTSVEWLHQDIRALEGLENLDAVVSYCDVINYLTTPQEVETVFHHVAAMLRPGGMFLFDVHHLPFIMNYYMNETFADVTDEVSYIWFCEPEEEYGTMVHHLTFFYLTNGIYKRFDEKHVQRVFSINFYKEILNQAGFQNIKVFADFTTKEENIDDDAARIFFSAQKESR
jgi:2-polyprenyl-3-methyl-5-hydroxy-6-metoxy-1,4-benzoquinol methylase